MERWEGKVAVVTGASSGIGAAIVRDLTRAGLTVVGLARRVERVEAIATELSSASAKGKLIARQCDVSKEKEVLDTFTWIKEKLGGVDVLVNNAGIARPGPLITDGNTEEMRSVIDTNLWGLIICTREAVKSMKERDVAGHVVNINSVAGHCVPSVPGMQTMFNVYPATKHGVTALTETLRQELRDTGSQVKVSSISPGIVLTEVMDASDPTGKGTEFIKNSPHLESEDISQAVLYVLGTPPHVQVHELIIKPIGELF